ncbi:MAG: Eco57I restriction-modification methylase domain-containing protein, partial [Acidimicrobiales bacterium]
MTHTLVDSASSVADPACGDGRFLRATAERGRRHVFGSDLVPVDGPVPRDTSIVAANTLVDGISVWPDAPADGFDLVIGNPPFRGQLQAETWLQPGERAQLVDRYGDLARGYVDTASLFLVAACEMAAPTGRVALIMPLSFLAARDAAPARRRVLELATLDGLWICPDLVFPDAQVQVCAVILDRSG